ncbi:2133_t:CDS:2, partial [Ambispora gerdemannii]
ASSYGSPPLSTPTLVNCSERISSIYKNGSDQFLIQQIYFMIKKNLSGLAVISFNIRNTSSNLGKQSMTVLPYYPDATLFVSSINDNNRESLGYGQYNLLRVAKSVRYILTDNPVNILSGNPKHDIIPYITSNTQTFASFAAGYGAITVLEMRPNSFAVETEKEISTLTVVDIFGAIGGFHSATKTFYGILFGASIIGPLGCIQSLPGVKSKVRNKLRINLGQIFSDLDNTDTTEKNGEEARITALEERQKKLELFLKECVVDVGILDDKKDKRTIIDKILCRHV